MMLVPLGKIFLDEIERAERLIKESPATWPILEGNLRRYLLRRFPFGIIYFQETKEIVVVAVAHLHRNPDYWKERI